MKILVTLPSYFVGLGAPLNMSSTFSLALSGAMFSEVEPLPGAFLVPIDDGTKESAGTTCSLTSSIMAAVTIRPDSVISVPVASKVGLYSMLRETALSSG